MCFPHRDEGPLKQLHTSILDFQQFEHGRRMIDSFQLTNTVIVERNREVVLTCVAIRIMGQGFLIMRSSSFEKRALFRQISEPFCFQELGICLAEVAM